MADLSPNMYAEYVDANTGAVISTDLFRDPELSWQWDAKRGWYLHRIYQDFAIPAEWHAANPMPVRAP